MQHWFRAPLAFLVATAAPVLASAQDVTVQAPPAIVAAPSAADPVDASPMLAAINAARAAENLAPLARDPGLDQVALAHSRDMLEAGFFDHVSPRTGDPAARMRTAGMRAPRLAENIALALSLRAAHESLMGSPAHRANLMDPGLTHIGIGVVRGPRGVLVTQLFAAASVAPAAPAAAAPAPAPAATAPVAPAQAQVIPAPAVVQIPVGPAPAVGVQVAPPPAAAAAPVPAPTGPVQIQGGQGVIPVSPEAVQALIQQLLQQLPAAAAPYVSPRQRPTAAPTYSGGTYWTWDGTRWVPYR